MVNEWLLDKQVYVWIKRVREEWMKEQTDQQLLFIQLSEEHSLILDIWRWLISYIIAE